MVLCHTRRYHFDTAKSRNSWHICVSNESQNPARFGCMRGAVGRDLIGGEQPLRSVKKVCYTAVGTSNLCNGTGRAVSFDECHLGV